MTLKKETSYYSRPPQSFRCPLSGKLMEDPVTDLCAHNFDRATITAFLGNHSRCPISRKPLHVDDLVANHSLAEQVERWTFHRDNDGLVRELAGEESTANVSDDEEFGDLVNQMEKGIHNQRKKRQYNKTFLYDEVPPEFMLLPQERQMLASARTKMESTRALVQRKRCYRTTCALLGVFTVCVVVLIAWTSFATEDE